MDFVGDLLLEDLNYLVATSLRFVEFSDCALVLLFNGCEFLEGLFEHGGEFKSFSFVLLLILLHGQYN